MELISISFGDVFQKLSRNRRASSDRYVIAKSSSKPRGRLALLGQGDFAMADEEEQTQSGSGGDPRLEFIETYVKRTLKIKQDKWMKFMSNEEARQVLMDYFEKPEITYLVVYLNSSNQLAASDGFPGSSKNKAVYFVKHGKIALSKENLHSGLSFGDLSYAPLDQLSAVVENVSTRSTGFCDEDMCSDIAGKNR